jgi:hypothetical protein
MEAVMMEEAAMMEEARAMESSAGKPRPKRAGTREAGTAEVTACKVPTATHRGERHATAMHAAAEAAAMTTATAMSAAATTSGESGRSKRYADSECRRREKSEHPVLHETLSLIGTAARLMSPPAEERQKTRAQDRLQLTNAPDSDAGFRIRKRPHDMIACLWANVISHDP